MGSTSGASPRAPGSPDELGEPDEPGDDAAGDPDVGAGADAAGSGSVVAACLLRRTAPREGRRPTSPEARSAGAGRCAAGAGGSGAAAGGGVVVVAGGGAPGRGKAGAPDIERSRTLMRS